MCHVIILDPDRSARGRARRCLARSLEYLGLVEFHECRSLRGFRRLLSAGPAVHVVITALELPDGVAASVPLMTHSANAAALVIFWVEPAQIGMASDLEPVRERTAYVVERDGAQETALARFVQKTLAAWTPEIADISAPEDGIARAVSGVLTGVMVAGEMLAGCETETAFPSCLLEAIQKNFGFEDVLYFRVQDGDLVGEYRVSDAGRVVEEDAIVYPLKSSAVWEVFQWEVVEGDKHWLAVRSPSWEWVRGCGVRRGCKRLYAVVPVKAEMRSEPRGIVLVEIGERADENEFFRLEALALLCFLASALFDLRAAGARLRRELSFQEAVLSTVAAVIVILDPQGRVVRMNRAGLELTGYTEEEIRGKVVWDVLAPEEEREAVRQKFESLLTARRPLSYVGRWISKHGQEYWLRWSNSVLRDDQGKVVHVIGTGIDVTAEKCAERDQARMQVQLMQAAKFESIGVLAGGIAHNFNNLLMGILGCAELAMSELPEGSALRNDLESIKEAARKGAELTRQMLAFAGRGQISMGKVDLNALIRNTEALLRAAKPSSVVMRFELAEELPPVAGDESQLQQVVMALAANAFEAVQDRSGIVTLRTGSCRMDENVRGGLIIPCPEEALGRDFVYLEVEDTGPGIPADHLPRVFEPFFTTKFTGRGLGLAAVAGSVRTHKGGIAVRSEVDKGTKVRVYLQAYAEAKAGRRVRPGNGRAASEGKKHVRERPRGKAAPTILLADDEPLVLEVTKKILEREGYCVLTASDGRAALDVFRKHLDAIDLAVLDVAMPHVNGIEVCRAIRRARPALPVLISTGYTEKSQVLRGAGDLDIRVLEKPYDASILSNAVKEALAGRSRRGKRR